MRFLLSGRLLLPGALLLLLVLPSVVGPAPASAQPPPALDSVRARLARPNLPDTLRVRYLAELSAQLSISDLPAARRTAVQALALAQRAAYGRGVVSAYNVLAAIDYYASDYPAAQREFGAALAAARRARMPSQIANAWLGLGNVAQALNDVPRALDYFEQARRAYASVPDRAAAISGQLLVLNNSANAWLLVGQPAKAGRAFRRALALADPSPASPHARLVVSLLGNLAGLQDAAGHLDSARANLANGLALARATHDLTGEAAIQLEMAENALLLGQPAPARTYATRALALARQTGALPDAEQGLSVLAAALHTLHRPEAYDTLRAYLALHDTIMAQDRTNAIIEAQTRLDVAGQQARIRALEQERRIADLETESRALQTRWIVGWLAALAVLVAVGLTWRYRQRQARLEATLRARLAADLHDDVGSLLTQLTIQSGLLRENSYTPEQQRARLDGLADTSRRAALQLIDVVWSLDAANDSFGHLIERLREHAHDVLGSAEIGVGFRVDNELEAARFAPDVRQHIYLIFKEALHNIVKHAHATRVDIGLALDGRFLELHVHDNGPHPPTTPHRPAGRGLTGMHARAQAIGGTMAIGAEADGFGVRLRVPR